ncbi:carbohydrate kinase family protein [Candidatus Caldatribacterium sp.]|uniref:carbohydrate kinase family protein n=1 Tax=Candidatus Caldatribacterium sp. TaxID=2282143 RepID=UPI0029977934|nr:carbohydrate kinase family protein [Candidatus Caldatribacterium sp.]MDW8081270.1 carbohydrate kinase family protein [Candidatus Calescibacterium sp.]
MAKAFVVGNVSLDLVLGGIPDYPEWGTEILIPGYVMRPGGAASNAALALAALGVPTFVVATVGDDVLGADIRKQFAKASVQTDFLFHIPGYQTAISVGVTNARTKERSFLTDLGAQECLAKEHFESILPNLEDGDFILLCGYFLSPRLRGKVLAETLATLRKKCLLTILFDTGWPPEGWTTETRQEIQGLLSSFEYFLPNEKELEGVGGDTIFSLPRQGVIVKRGREGCTAYTKEGVFSVPTIDVPVTDTIGAGDYFNAGFIFGLACGYPLPMVLRCANLVASLNISLSATRDRLVTKRELENALFSEAQV